MTERRGELDITRLHGSVRVFKDDSQSQWGMAKFGPQLSKLVKRPLNQRGPDLRKWRRRLRPCETADGGHFEQTF